MQKETDVEFKSLLTEAEYQKLLGYFKNAKSDFQTNHYFDTKRFSLKALNTSLRVRERDNLELTLKRKKGYNTDIKSVEISKKEFEGLKETGIVKAGSIADDLQSLIKDQKVVNFLNILFAIFLCILIPFLLKILLF